MTSQGILDKIKFLLKLSASDNIHEANNARMGAEKLIKKFNVTDEELASIVDKKPAYGEDERLFHTSYQVPWKMQLSLAVANKFDCLIVQEESVPVEGNSEFDYYVCGDPDDIESVKIAFRSLLFLIDDTVNKNCIGEDENYMESYAEGLAHSIKENLEYGIYLPKREKKVKPEEVEVKPDAIAHIPTQKEKPSEKTYDIAGASRVTNVVAYYRGVADGKDLFFEDAFLLMQSIEQLESAQPLQLPSEEASAE